MDDSQLLILIKSEQTNALESLYEKYFEAIYRFFYFQTNFQVENAQDLTQDTFIEIAKSLKKFKGIGSLKNWIYTIAKRQLNHWLKKKYQIHELPLLETLSDTDNWIDPGSQTLKIQKLNQILSQLNPKEFQVINLRYLKNLSVKETAQKLKLSEANVKVISHRAINNLKKNNL